MPRIPDPNSPAAERVIQGDCISEVGPDLLERIIAYHRGEEPPDTNFPIDPIPEEESSGTN